MLADHFLKRYVEETGKHLEGFTQRALGLLTSYHWPGNIRELRNVIERAVVIARGRMIGAEELTFLNPHCGSVFFGADDAGGTRNQPYQSRPGRLQREHQPGFQVAGGRSEHPDAKNEAAITCLNPDTALPLNCGLNRGSRNWRGNELDRPTKAMWMSSRWGRWMPWRFPSWRQTCRPSLASTPMPCRLFPTPNMHIFHNRDQYTAGKILKALESLTDGARFRLGVAQFDLCTPILEFVFGESQLGGKAAVISLLSARRQGSGTHVSPSRQNRPSRNRASSGDRALSNPRLPDEFFKQSRETGYPPSEILQRLRV